MGKRSRELYNGAIHRSLGLDGLDPWCASFMRDRKARIEHDVPYVELG